MGGFFRPDSVAAALAVLAARPVRVLAGGTDVYAAAKIDGDLLDVTGLAELRGIAARGDHWWFGALATWSDVIAADLPAEFDALKQAAAQVGGRQVQNAGTLVGNLCNASPAADGVPCLMALDASVELASASGRRVLALRDFLLGPRRTARRADEMVLGVRVPMAPVAGRSVFAKLGARRYLVISIVSLAANGWYEGGRLARLHLVAGACSAVPVRLRAAEAALLGGGEVTLPEIAPIGDVRAPADYRAAALREMIGRVHGYFV